VSKVLNDGRASVGGSYGAKGRFAPRVGASGGACFPTSSSTSRAMPTQMSGYAMGPSPSDCSAEIPCHAHLLGFTTIGAPGGFPLAGGAASIVLNVQPQNSTAYKPAYLFWEARDNAANLGAVLGLLVDARISGQPQFTSGNAANLLGAIPSSAFSVDTPLDVRTWQAFSSINNNQLALTLNNPGGGAVQAHFFGVFWGDNQEAIR
jgi:hypothetical protein